MNLGKTLLIYFYFDCIGLSGSIEDPYFCGTDVCVVLGYVDTRKALQRCIDDNDDTYDSFQICKVVGEIMSNYCRKIFLMLFSIKNSST